jgi:putative nucleotidyltransferase with HDIG domain
MPTVYAALLKELQSEDGSIQGVAKIIEQDVGMTAKLMQMVNSSFFGIPRRVESPSHAAAMLGMNLLKPLVLSAGIFSQFDERTGGYSVDALMEHSLAVSHLAAQIATSCSDDHALVEETMLAGLLHDVGQLLLAAQMPEEFGSTLALARERDVPLCVAELEFLGAHHADVGAYLLGLWGLANPIVEAVAFHHEPAKCHAVGFQPLTAVHVANNLVNERQQSGEIHYSLDLDTEYLNRCGVAGHLSKWRLMADDYYAQRGLPV